VSSKIKIFLDGFVGKFHNRRVRCFLRKDGDYTVIFIKFSKENYTKDELNQFQKYFIRLGGTLTYKYVRLSEQALITLAEGFIAYKEYNQ
jgi:hypothetical protein